MKNTTIERLTFKERNGHFGICGMNEDNEEQKITDAVHRLMQYEETGLSPEQIRMLQKNNSFQFISFDELKKQDTNQECIVILKKEQQLLSSFPIKLILEQSFLQNPAQYELVIFQCPCKSKLKNKTLKGGD